MLCVVCETMFGIEKHLDRLVEISALTGYLKGIEIIETYREKTNHPHAWRMGAYLSSSDVTNDFTEVCNITDRLEELAFPLRTVQETLEVKE